jgi:NTE family protein
MDARLRAWSSALGSQPTAGAVAGYAPRPKSKRRGTALCLSGGGYRAALFHLGAARRLNELGILTQVDTFSSVSGGSIFAAHLVRNAHQWPGPGRVVPNWDDAIARPFRRFTKRNIRTLPLARRALPWNWRKSETSVQALARLYEKFLVSTRFDELPQRPRFVFCATDLPFGVNWVFDSGVIKGRMGRKGQNRDCRHEFEETAGFMGDYQVGYRSSIGDWPVARAVAASSCFPPIFGPLAVNMVQAEFRGGAYCESDRDELIANIRLSDGGVYDNLGLEPVWKDHQTVLVSDGGGVFEGAADVGSLWRISQYLSIVESQSRALRKRWLISSFLTDQLQGTYWGIGSATADYESTAPGYSEQLVDDIISEVRTDLDAFTEAEIAVLENHGYLMAEAAIQRHAPELIRQDAVPLRVPHPSWQDETRVWQDLAGSHKRTLLGRWLS